jgi:CheY-like chemotaxis protein
MTAVHPNPVSAVLIPAPVARKRGRILVVDDEPSICQLIDKILRSAGYEDIIFSSNGSYVPNLALSERPQLIIMDVMMPGGNGLRALRALKNSAVTAEIPVIITSGFNVPTQEDCPQTQANQVLHKPFSTDQLLKAVGRLIPD